MYAERELKRLGDVKVIVRRRIARRRSETIEQVDRVIVPVRWADRAWSWWKSVSPMAKLAAAPVGTWLIGTLFKRRKAAGSLVRWGPTIWSAVQGFLRARA
jgi:hypothetical protein